MLMPKTFAGIYDNYIDAVYLLHEQCPTLAPKVSAALSDHVYAAIKLVEFQFLSKLIPSTTVSEGTISLRPSPLRDLLCRLVPTGTDNLTLMSAVETFVGISLDMALEFEDNEGDIRIHLVL